MTPAQPTHPIVVIGGGVAGLALARALVRGGDEAVVLEATPRAGGLLVSERRDGYLCDWAANAFLAGEPGGAVDLCRELGVEVVEAAAAAKQRWVFRGGKLRAVPTSPPLLLSTDLLSWRGKLRLLAEPLVGRGKGDAAPRASAEVEEETVDAFFRRRLGAEAADALVAPFVLGVFAGESDALSMAAAFPRLHALEARHGGLLRGLFAERRARRQQAGAVAKPAARQRLWSPRAGTGALTDALARELGPRLRTSCRVVAVERRGGPGGGYLVQAVDDLGEHLPPIAASALAFATPAGVTAALCAPLDDELARLANTVPSPSVAVAFVSFDAAAAPRAQDGFGLLVARGEKPRALGVVFESVLWPGRAPAGQALFRVIYGGGRDPGAAALFDDELHGQVLADLRVLLGVTAAPRFFHSVRHDAGIPQYTPGHAGRARAAAQRADALGVELAGNAWRAVAVNELVREAPAIAERLRRRVRGGSPAAAAGVGQVAALGALATFGVLAALGALAACSGPGRPMPSADVGPGNPVAAAADAGPKVTPPSGPNAPYTAQPDGPSGVVLGLITLARPAARAAVAPTPGPAACPGSTASPPALLAPNGGVVGAVVWLDDIERGKAMPGPDAPAAELTFDGCVLTPRVVLVAGPGGKLAVRNEDPVRHQAKLTFAPATWLGAGEPQPLAEWPLPLVGQRFELTVDQPGIVTVAGDLAPAPHALAVVPRHPYFAVTDADGRYRFPGVPPGQYKVRAWHPAMEGEQDLWALGVADVLADGAAEVNLTLVVP